MPYKKNKITKTKLFAVVDDTDNLFFIKGGLSIFRTKEEAILNCEYCEEVKEAILIVK